MHISKFGRTALALLCTVFTVPALASGSDNVSPKSATVPAPTEKDAHSKEPPDLAAMAAFVDKLFPPQPEPEPARLGLARITVQAMWPDGAYGNMMAGFLGSMFDRLMQMKTSDVAALATKEAPKSSASSKSDLSLHDKEAAKDPYFDQRMAAMRDVLTQEMSKISAIVDPSMRNGLARAMARRFDVQQLTDVNRFFSTSTGSRFASQYMQLWIDPDTIRSVLGSAPQLMKLMPEIAAKLKAANDKFPKPPAAASAQKP